MRKIIPFMVIVLITLSGCNLTLQPTSVLPTFDVLGTQVAQYLTSTAAVIQPVSTTAVARSTSTTSPTQNTTRSPGTTVAPSPTLEPSATPTITTTPGTTRPATLTPTPTGIPGDPVTSLGKPDWKDDFQKASTWGLQTPYDDGNTRVSITSDKLVIKSYDSNGWRGWRMMNIKIKDFYLETTLQTLACSGSDEYGIIFRSSDNFKGYWLNITCDGHYSMDVGDINGLDSVIPSKTTPLINAGSNQANRFGIMVQGNKISIYVNGKLVEDVTNDAIGNAGAFGYFIAANKTAGFTFESTEIAYWNLP